jgi:hypothetical protein
MKGEIHMEKKYSFSFDNLFGDIEETIFTYILALTIISPVLYMFLK